MDLNAIRIITDDVDRLVEFSETVSGVTAKRLHPLSVSDEAAFVIGVSLDVDGGIASTRMR